MRHDIYGPYAGKIQLEKLVPRVVPLWEEKVEKEGVSTVREHVRAGRMEVLNLFTGEVEGRVRQIPGDWKSPMEISCRNYCCAYPFNIDPFESGGCFACRYCFSTHTKSSMYSSWFDGDIWAPRFPKPGYITDVLSDVLKARGVEPTSRVRVDPENPPKWEGTVGSMLALKKAAAQGIPLRMGNRSEPFFPPEQQHGATPGRLLRDHRNLFLFLFKLIVAVVFHLFRQVAKEPSGKIIGQLGIRVGTTELQVTQWQNFLPFGSAHLTEDALLLVPSKFTIQGDDLDPPHR